ncbi:TonB-dependent vitamin B12 receptor [Montanilutibacter psychrotolerans]|uniref:TonB-dependent vitamin B12 receptor n=1 Tax=Montanilutibacter psychrotolerans TaxID=1327343 RepID=A0A3M8SLX6_9GAMM|nr:TonB-dependent vitamin B12 receptor [Lysobacter psychrotolerans]RNF82229.1 TonB-dependent vitamin B12 receptor [Lysobacter psychrotolerans]
MQFRPLFVALACALALPVHAQDHDDATALDKVVVTATRTSISANDALAPVEVIDRVEIERSQARSLPDLLRGRAGISQTNQGGAGKLTTMFMRGTESDHVLVLIDGVRVGSPTSGLAAFQDLPIEMIDRVEIVRGPRSSLYGADAIGGVIQVFTRRDQQGYAPRVTVGGGSNGLHEYNVGFGGRGKRGWFGADYAFRRTEGIDACRGIGFPTYSGCGTATPEKDLDGYINNSLSLRGGIDLNEQLTLEAHALRAEGENDFDGDFTDRSEVVQQVIGGSARWRPNDRVDVRLSAGRNVDASDSFIGDVFTGYFDTDRDSATLQGDFTLARDQVLTVGLDWLRDRVESDTAYVETGRSNRAAFVQYQGTFGAHSLQASVRRDDNDQFGGHNTGSAAWGIAFGDGWRVTASYGTAFKAPTFIELYYPFGFGNPDLSPEKSRSAELGLAWQKANHGVALNVFETRVEDLIGTDIAFRAININEARVRGAELTANASFGVWDASASASFADPENRSTPYEGKQLPRRARTSARIDVDRAFGSVRLGVTAAGEGARYDDFANTRRVGGHALLDLRGEIALSSAWTLQARLANVFDRDYETVEYYRQPGREWFLTMRYAPKN